VKYKYVTTDKSIFLTPFKRISHEVISETPELIHSIIKYENGLVCESKVYSDRIEMSTNMEFIKKDGVTYELRK
jgi:hypothetical protein